MGALYIQNEIANLTIGEFFTEDRFEAYGLEPMIARRARYAVERGCTWDYSKGYRGERIVLKTVGEFMQLYLLEDKTYYIEGVGPVLEEAILGVLKPYIL